MKVLSLVLALLAAGCGAYSPMHPLPSVLTPLPEGVLLQPRVTDYEVLAYVHGVKLVLAGRVTNLERGDLAAALATSGLAATGSILASTGTQASVIAALVAVGAMVSNATAIINPAIRANALSEGNGSVLKAEGRYFICLSDAEISRVSRQRITSCGAHLLAETNDAIAETNRLLVGLRPGAPIVSGESKPSTPPAEIVKMINEESDSPKASTP